MAALPEITESQHRHDRRTANFPDQDIARIHHQATGITSQWLEAGWHPALTERWQRRRQRLAPAFPGPGAALTDVITHPEMLAIARLLISGQRTRGIRPGDVADRLGFRYPSRPHPLDPLQANLTGLTSLAATEPGRHHATAVTSKYPGSRRQALITGLLFRA